MKNTTDTKPRRRNIATAATVKTPSAALVSLAAQVYQANIAKNAADKAYESARAKLLTEMRDAEIKQFTASATIGDKVMSIDVCVATPLSNYIDVVKLRSVTTDAVFMDCVSASKTAVTEFAGAAVATQCTAVGHGKENVTVKLTKA